MADVKRKQVGVMNTEAITVSFIAVRNILTYGHETSVIFMVKYFNCHSIR